MSLKTRLLICEYKEKFPQLSPEEICDAFSTELKSVERLFKLEFIEVPSKMNRKR
jgi:hypothetical protein